MQVSSFGLRESCVQKDFHRVKLLLEGNVDPNSDRDGLDQSPLIHAALQNHARIADLLLDHNADIDHTDKVHFEPISHRISFFI